MRLAIEPDMVILGETGNGATAIDLVPVLKPDVVVMDIEMPGMDGITAARTIRSIAPRTAVVVLTVYDNSGNRREATVAGVVAFVGKHEAVEALPAAIRQAARFIL